MRTLCVAGVYPWPAEDGYRLRLANMVAALADEGEVDFVCISRRPVRDAEPPPPGVRALVVTAAPVGMARRLVAWARSGLPRSQVNRSTVAANATAAAWLRGPYDLTYLSHITSWFHHHDLTDGPTIVDLDNLEHLITRAARSNRPAASHPRVLAKWLALQPIERIDERRMERLQLRCAAAVDRVTLCSDLDAERSGMRNAVVIGNGYDRIGSPPLDRSGHRLIFVGALGYAPNSDAVRWFAREVLPQVRRQVPEATFRVVGGGEDAVADVAGLPGVEVVGRVSDLQAELDAATVAVVPLRSGSGTRLKVVEALANRLPIVSTTLGAEGIELVDGAHVLLADEPDALAAACVRLLGDDALRRRLAGAGEALWDDRYRWARMRGELVALARQVVADA